MTDTIMKMVSCAIDLSSKYCFEKKYYLRLHRKLYLLSCYDTVSDNFDEVAFASLCSERDFLEGYRAFLLDLNDGREDDFSFDLLNLINCVQRVLRKYEERFDNILPF